MSFEFMTLPETTLHYRLILGDPAQPTFIFETGYGQDLSTWHPILDQIEALGTILMYDRTNTGGSSPYNSETSQQSVNRLHRLIRTLSLKPPFILVGHSYGGTLVRQFASQYPNEVSGLLLIDATPESYIQRFLPVMPKSFQSKYQNQFTLECTYADFKESIEATNSDEHYIFPLIVLSAGKKEHYSRDAQLLWHELQRQTARQSLRGSFINVSNSGHFIHHDAPDKVIHALQTLISECS
ncbi:alpha/beta fold hydrolase [Exiguobacterium acetylicum]|uniref:alpha/beta fold hydrolase n=1 Tax=Exiguobacterium acetylicum TaxID=41170 RepID=UPI001EE3020A|nr:alpha/beta hydrolase [Exiguobacterium acetylicum]UKS54670.1 alpha/beta hydrolase [Exiguobacterium acetylicum]